MRAIFKMYNQPLKPLLHEHSSYRMVEMQAQLFGAVRQQTVCPAGPWQSQLLHPSVSLHVWVTDFSSSSLLVGGHRSPWWSVMSSESAAFTVHTQKCVHTLTCTHVSGVQYSSYSMNKYSNATWKHYAGQTCCYL